MFTEDDFAEAARRSVERFKDNYSTDELWEMLESRWQRELELRPNSHRFYNLAHKDWKDAALFKREWQKVVDELKANEEMIECISRHLKGRNDADIQDWLDNREEYLRRKAIEWVGLCYLTDEDKKPKFPKLRLVYSR